MLQSFIRRYNYIEDYFHTLYEYYIKIYPAFPITYYSLEINNKDEFTSLDISGKETIWDDTQLLAGSYEKLGVGELSGVKWKKISSLPVFNTAHIELNKESNEQGYTFKDSMVSNISIPQLYKLNPIPGDVVDLTFGLNNVDHESHLLYVITNINLAHHGDDFNMYRCDLRVAPFSKLDLEKQISNFYSFFQPSYSILPLINVNKLNNLLYYLNLNIKELNTKFKDQIGIYLDNEI